MNVSGAIHGDVQASCEQMFSTAGNLSDPNMDPKFLGTLVSIMKNKAAFNPPRAAIKEKYFAKFRGKGKEKVGTVAVAGDAYVWGGGVGGGVVGDARVVLHCEGNSVCQLHQQHDRNPDA